ncbi:MAG TPA: hypothetical protein VEW48_12570 [Thermoanaerobaculia bacterium]|nr:hypothetical protein [Thermoanaerobaculia bacterium]
MRIAPERQSGPGSIRDHPDPDLLERFVRGELSGAAGRAACRTIVRHLLAGCPQCARIVRRLWALGELPGDPSPLVD